MSSSPSIRRSGTRSHLATGLLLVAAVAWGLVLLWQHKTGPAQQRVDAGIAYFQAGQAEKAEQAWREAVQIDPQNVDAWELLGEHHLKTRNWPAGLEAYHHLLRLTPDKPDVRARLALCALRSGDATAAYRFAQEELQRDPNNVTALNLCATLLASSGDSRRQLEYLRRLIRLQPDDLDVLTRLAVELTFRRHHAEAAPLLERILRLNPQSAQAYSLRGVASFDQDASPEGLARAEADFRRSLELSPNAPFPHLYLGKIYRRKGLLENAVRHLEEAARRMPDKKEIFFELASVYEKAGAPQKAARVRRRFEALQREEEQEDTLRKRCAAAPDDLDSHMKLARLLLKKGDYRGARFCLDRAGTLHPQNEQVQAAFRQLQSLEAANQPGRRVSGVEFSAGPAADTRPRKSPGLFERPTPDARKEHP